MILSVSSAWAEGPMRLAVDASPLVIKTAKELVSYDVEVARSSDERSQGLMFRRDFPKKRAMLFVFPRSQYISMWMQNTPLPLDMVFVDKKGRVASITTGAVPFSTDIISSSVNVNYVIELNAGQVGEKSIAVGDHVHHPAICGKCDDN